MSDNNYCDKHKPVYKKLKFMLTNLQMNLFLVIVTTQVYKWS